MKRSGRDGPDLSSETTTPDNSLVALPNWPAAKPADDRPVLTLDAPLMHDLATRSLAAGGGGLAKIGVASVNHGEGTTTIARSLATCLADRFGQRVMLVEANQRSPCLRELCRLTPGPGLSDVLSGSASLESALRVSGNAEKILVLPASMPPSFNASSRPAASWRDLAAELFFYADALVLDLAPLAPYPDTLSVSLALDGVALVMQAGRAKRADSARAVETLKRAGVPILGAILNRERRFVPRFLERML